MIDILIKDGLIYDGSLNEPYISDIAVSGDKIESIGSFNIKEAGVVIEAKGFAVSPGFIDSHAHSDFTLLADPRAEGKIFQGITTEINGNCGMSAAPMYNKALEKREDDLKQLGIRERWNTLEEYFAVLTRKNTAVNTAIIAGHGNIRGSVLGYDDRGPSSSELLEMSMLLKTAIKHGAIGLSTGLIYPPGVYSCTDEIIKLAEILKDRNLIYTSHMRSESDMLIEAVREVLRIGQEANVGVHISHIKTSGENNWYKADAVIEMLHEARNKGVMVTCDRYPYIASGTDLDSILPSWAYDGGNEEEIKRLNSVTERVRMKQEMKISTDQWKKIIISSVVSEKNRWMEGSSIYDICKRINADETDFVFDLLIEEKLRVGAIFLSMNENNLAKFLSLPFCMIGTDSSARSFDGPTRTGKPHPRGFGSFPKLLGKYVRDEKLMPLSAAVNKSTMLPAMTFGLKGRGIIKEGMFADIVIFSPEKIKDTATFEDPYRKPEGIYYVLVNGTPAVYEGKPTGKRAGKILKQSLGR
jgi:N-acyl-D-amino-acid deacylase